MKLYLSGPMRGQPEFNRAEFDRWAAVLRSAKHTVVSPSELDQVAPLDGTSEGNGAPWLIRDLLLLQHAGFDGVALMPGWRQSQGCKLEVLFAQDVGLPLYEVTVGGLVPVSVHLFPAVTQHAKDAVLWSNRRLEVAP